MRVSKSSKVGRSGYLGNTRRGFTLLEILVVLSIMSIILVVLLRFSATGYHFSREIRSQQQAVENARIQLKRISKAIRETRFADTGAYPLVDMQPDRIIFYSDVDADSTVERIRYELNQTDLERGVTEPTSDPLIYDVENNEQVSVVAKSIRNGYDPIFTYYNGDYPADTTPLTPIDLTEVKYVQFRLLIDVDPEADPAVVDVRSQVQLRNLKTNLGQTVE